MFLSILCPFFFFFFFYVEYGRMSFGCFIMLVFIAWHFCSGAPRPKYRFVTGMTLILQK